MYCPGCQNLRFQVQLCNFSPAVGHDDPSPTITMKQLCQASEHICRFGLVTSSAMVVWADEHPLKFKMIAEAKLVPSRIIFGEQTKAAFGRLDGRVNTVECFYKNKTLCKIQFVTVTRASVLRQVSCDGLSGRLVSNRCSNYLCARIRIARVIFESLGTSTSQSQNSIYNQWIRPWDKTSGMNQHAACRAYY